MQAVVTIPGPSRGVYHPCWLAIILINKILSDLLIYEVHPTTYLFRIAISSM